MAELRLKRYFIFLWNATFTHEVINALLEIIVNPDL